MRFIFSILFIAISFKSISQHGTLIIASIIENKYIAFAADSRGSFYIDSNHHKLQIAYVDSMEKIFQLKHFILAISGAEGRGKTLYSTIVNKYNQTKFKSDNIEETLNDFIRFLDSNYSESSFHKDGSGSLFIGGYEKSVPKIIAINLFTHQKIMVTDGFLTNADYFEELETYLSNDSLDFPRRLENAIYSYAIKNNKTTNIGGGISMGILTDKNIFKWWQNDFSKLEINKEYLSNSDIKDDKYRITYLIPNGKEILLNHRKAD